MHVVCRDMDLRVATVLRMQKTKRQSGRGEEELDSKLEAGRLTWHLICCPSRSISDYLLSQ